MPVQSEIRSIFADTQAPAVSIFLPTHRAGPEIEQDPIRLKNLIKQAEEQLLAEGTRAASARDLLAPISELVRNAAFWRYQSDGLAIFRSPDSLRTQRLPFTVREFVSVGDRFYIKPLLPLLLHDVRFFVLALSQNAVRLIECTREGAAPVALPDVPQGMAEALPEGPGRQLQFHSVPIAGQSVARFHGHGMGADDADVENLKRYFHRVEDGLQPVLKDEREPLILACVEYLAPIFKEVSAYRPILDPIVAGNPDGLKDDELQRSALPLAEAHFAQHRDKAVAEFREGAAKGRAGHGLADVLTAAHQGRIATLFVPLGVRRWGRFDFDRLALEEHDQEQPGDEELLDLAAMQTLSHGGTVYGTKPEDMPDGHLLAAVYRY